jgi:hypothetical protein
MRDSSGNENIDEEGVELPKEEVDAVVNAWVETVKTPVITGGYFTENDNFVNISTTWSVVDLVKKERVSFSRHTAVLKSSMQWPVGDDVIDDSVLILNTSDPVIFNG